MPRRLSNRVRVRHENGAEKDVARARLSQLSGHWSRVPRSQRRSAEPANTATEPAEPASQKE